jgi:hypothetical protein
MTAVGRLLRAWQAMDRERRLAASASVALFISMFLPWYQQNAVVNAPKTVPLQSQNLNAFQVFSFVEAAVLLVAMALLYMLFARAEGREFNLPGGDGTIVLAAGLWTCLLLIFRLFDKPGISSHGVAGNVGVQWGIFFALAASGLIAYCGSRMRAAHAGGRLPRHSSDPDPGAPDPYADAAAAFGAGAEAEQPRARGRRSEEEATRPISAPGARAEPARAGGRSRPRYPPSPEEQLSFEDPPARPQ